MQKLSLLLAVSVLLTALVFAQQTIDHKSIPPPEEIISLRTEYSETYDNHDGTRTTRVYAGKKFYKDGGEYKRIDLSIKMENVGDFTSAVKAGTYTYRYHATDMTKGHRFEKGNYYVTYIPAGNWTGKTSTVTPYADGIKEEITFSSKTDSSVSWDISTNTQVSFSEGVVTFRDSMNAFIFMIPKAVAFDSTGAVVPVTVSLKGDSLFYTLSYALSIPEGVTWPITLDPTTTITAVRDGHIVSYDTNYLTARDASSGAAYTFNWRVGQTLAGGGNYNIFRAFAGFPIPENIYAVNACSLYINGDVDLSVTDYDIYIHGASEYSPTLEGDDFPRFDGRQTGQGHNGAILTESWNSSSYSSGWNHIVFNTTGRNSVKAATGDTLWIALISKKDYDNSTPTNDEYIAFDSTEDTGTEPYLSLVYEVYVYNEDATTSFDLMQFKTHKADSSSYSGARGTASYGDVTSTTIDTLGQWKAVVGDYRNYRSAFIVPGLPHMNEVLACSLFVTGAADSSSTDFDIQAFSGTWNTGNNEGYRFYTFDGHQSGTTVYNGTQLLEPFNTSSFNASGPDTLIFNAAGRQAMLDASQDTLRIVLISSRDVNANEPSAAEYVVLNSTDAELRVTWALNDSLPGNFTMTPIDPDSIAVSWEDKTFDETGFRLVNEADTTSVYFMRSDKADSTTTARAISSVPTGYSGVYPDDFAFNNNLGDLNIWHTASVDGGVVPGGFPHWIGQDFGAGNEKRIGKYSIYIRHDTVVQAPRDWTLQAANDTTSAWAAAVNIDTQDEVSDWSIDETKTYHVNPINTTAYRYWRLHITEDQDQNLDWISINEIEFIEATDTTAANAESVRVGGLDPNTSYAWRVQVVGGAYADSLSAPDSTYTHANAPISAPAFELISNSAFKVVIDTTGTGNPDYTEYAIQDSLSGWYIDATAEPETLRTTPLGEWGWRSYDQWGAALGDTLTGLFPDSLYVIRAKARSCE
ncbi:hypothetical protein ACFL1R_07385 [Candidatus Latescibacterota bacterium]